MKRGQWVRIMVSLLYSLAVMFMVGQWAVRYAFMERGYVAAGGEYLFILLVAWGAYQVIDIFFSELEGSGIWKEQ